MVNHKRIRSKLPELMIDGPLTEKENFYDYKKLDRKLRRMERHNSMAVDLRVRNITRELKMLEETLKASF